MSRLQSEKDRFIKQASALLISEHRATNIAPHLDPYRLSSVLSNDVVRYRCSCNQLRTLYNTYFCRHCLTLRCRSCVAHEVDSQYCQHCLEYIPTIDPKFQMNKCASCYQCPSCQHLLTVTVLNPTSLSSEQSKAKEEPVKRMCQLICEFCRWSSNSFIADSTRTLENFADVEVRNASRIEELVAYYKAASQKERADKKKRRYHSRGGNTMDLLKKYGIDNTLSPKLFESLRARTNFRDKSNPGTKYQTDLATTDESAIDTFKPSCGVESEQLNSLDLEFHYDKNYSSETISSIEQRLSQVELQPDRVRDFKPVSKSLSVKRSLRCKECERNLCRSEYSPISTRFKIQSAAYYHVPELKLRYESYPFILLLHESNIVEFTLQNQTLSIVKVKIGLDETYNSDLYDILLPKHELSLGPKDDTVDLDHVPVGMRPLNEETQVTYQSHSRLGFYIKIKPKTEVELLEVSFTMCHDIILPQSPRDSDRCEKITHKLYVKLGPVLKSKDVS